MTHDRYNEGWRDACSTINNRLKLIAPEDEAVILAAYQIRIIIQETRNVVDEPLPPPELTDWQKQLARYGIRP